MYYNNRCNWSFSRWNSDFHKTAQSVKCNKLLSHDANMTQMLFWCVQQEIKLSGSEEGAGPGLWGYGGRSLHSANLQGEVRFYWLLHLLQFRGLFKDSVRETLKPASIFTDDKNDNVTVLLRPNRCILQCKCSFLRLQGSRRHAGVSENDSSLWKRFGSDAAGAAQDESGHKGASEKYWDY